MNFLTRYLDEKGTSNENANLFKMLVETLFLHPTSEPDLINTQCFRDNTRTIDFVLVYSENDSSLAPYRLNFLNNITLDGLEYEIEKTVLPISDLFYVKIHVSDNIIRELVNIFNIKLKTKKRYKKPIPYTTWGIYFGSVLTHVFENEEFLLNQYNAEFTTAERSLIVYNVLINIFFGETENEVGLHNCIKKNIFSMGFPLHDGPKEWPEDPKIKPTIRQLLFKYWADYWMCLTMQPLDLIEEYFGDETAIFFAWLNFYNRWMFYACIISICSLFATFIQYDAGDRARSKELCHSHKILCPYCLHRNYCSFIHLKDWCLYSHWESIVDNNMSVLFALFFTIWGICLMLFWRRKMESYNFRWNLNKLDLNTELREAYIRNFKHTHFPNVSENTKKFLRSLSKFFRYFISFSIMTSMVFALFLMMVTLTLYRLYMKSYLSLHQNTQVRNFSQIILICSASTLSVISTMSLELVYNKMALILTEFECPRTQFQFDQSYIFKKFAFSFLCYFTPIFYLAFFKGQFFAHPGDKNTQNNLIKSDRCSPTGCFLELHIQMVSTLVIRHSVMFSKQIILPKIKSWWNKTVVYPQNIKLLPRWEQDYQLQPFKRFTLTEVMQDFVLQYAFVLLFIVTFPAAPLIAFGFNLFDIRFNAHTILTYYQRPIARNYSGLGMWSYIIQAITFMAFCTNGFTIALNSQFIPRVYYSFYSNHYHGFLNFTLSEFLIKDYGNITLPPLPPAVTSCYFTAFRVQPESPNKYQSGALHWNIFVFRLLFAICYEHLLLLLTALIVHFIPTMPWTLVKQIEAEQSSEEKQLRDEFYLKQKQIQDSI